MQAGRPVKKKKGSPTALLHTIVVAVASHSYPVSGFPKLTWASCEQIPSPFHCPREGCLRCSEIVPFILVSYSFPCRILGQPQSKSRPTWAQSTRAVVRGLRRGIPGSGEQGRKGSIKPLASSQRIRVRYFVHQVGSQKTMRR